MAGVTDLSFRILCKEYGAGMVYTEMVSAKGLCYEDKKTHMLTKIEEIEKPVALQIFGSEPDFMAKAAYKLNELDNGVLDINMGCPTPKIVKNGDGSALMKNPKLAGEVIKAVVKESIKPVTVKIRKGWDDYSINAVEMAKIIEESGASLVAVHGRTREEFYTGVADWDIIAEVKKAVSIPVIGNGDVFSVEDAKKMIEKTKCDGVMIARGAQGNPWIFKRVAHYLKTGQIIPKPTVDEKITLIKRHLELLIHNKSEYVAVREIRKHIAWYFKGVKNSNKLRAKSNTLNSKEEIISLLDDFLVDYYSEV